MSKSTVANDTTMMDLLEKAWVKEGYVYNKEYGYLGSPIALNARKLKTVVQVPASPHPSSADPVCHTASLPQKDA
ncbi:hypothetical protein llap_7422 [Limosa lapponica baueri]|uniref:Uncharacterized protein n=1 Tax=Limosa lapponica baueri TaxID=1758121 RepID=A0A2I0U8A6_LIMLA|nr:hypothetical protein llap_7422 [Limosa lapponica baueri]